MSILNYPNAGTLGENDFFYVVQNGLDKKATFKQIPEATIDNKGLLGIADLKKINGLANYKVDIDANTTLYNKAVVSGKNMPYNSNAFWYLIQIFYNKITDSSNRLQIAISYDTGAIYTRISKAGVFDSWNKFQYSTISNAYSLEPNALTDTIIEEVPMSADTPMTLQETGQPAPTIQKVERYEYSAPKMAEAILTLQKELEELKGGVRNE